MANRYTRIFYADWQATQASIWSCWAWYKFFCPPCSGAQGPEYLITVSELCQRLGDAVALTQYECRNGTRDNYGEPIRESGKWSGKICWNWLPAIPFWFFLKKMKKCAMVMVVMGSPPMIMASKSLHVPQCPPPPSHFCALRYGNDRCKWRIAIPASLMRAEHLTFIYVSFSPLFTFLGIENCKQCKTNLKR